jgi:hypothetical protein
MMIIMSKLMHKCDPLNNRGSFLFCFDAKWGLLGQMVSSDYVDYYYYLMPAAALAWYRHSLRIDRTCIVSSCQA